MLFICYIGMIAALALMYDTQVYIVLNFKDYENIAFGLCGCSLFFYFAIWVYLGKITSARIKSGINQKPSLDDQVKDSDSDSKEDN